MTASLLDCTSCQLAPCEDHRAQLEALPELLEAANGAAQFLRGLEKPGINMHDYGHAGKLEAAVAKQGKPLQAARHQYVAILVSGGVIESLHEFNDVDEAREFAEKTWKDCDAETDDVKVMKIGDPDTYYWMPPDDDEEGS